SRALLADREPEGGLAHGRRRRVDGIQTVHGSPVAEPSDRLTRLLPAATRGPQGECSRQRQDLLDEITLLQHEDEGGRGAHQASTEIEAGGGLTDSARLPA